MPGPASIMRELHRLRRTVTDLDSKIENAPRQLKAQTNKLAQQEEGLKQAQEGLKHVKMKIHDKEVSIKASQTQITKYEKQRNEASNKKEYDTLGAEIKSAQEHIRKIEDEILELMDEAETKGQQIPIAEKALQKSKADFIQFEKDQLERLSRFQQEIKTARAELAVIEATLPADILPGYNRLVKAKGADAITSVQGSNCTACYTDITAQMHNDLTKELFVHCRNCGRILYLEG